MDFFLILGPSAVGKMTVGQALAKRLGYKLFHNHHSIEFALQYFDHGKPEFRNINEGMRQLVFKTVAESRSLKGFIFTLVMAFDSKDDIDYIANIKNLFSKNGWNCYTVELYAPQQIRIARNDTPNRLQHKVSKRNVEQSLAFIKQAAIKYQLNTEQAAPKKDDYLWIDNSHLSPEEVVDKIIEKFAC